MGGRGGSRAALCLSALIRTELACKGVKIVSANPYKVKIWYNKHLIVCNENLSEPKMKY